MLFVSGASGASSRTTSPAAVAAATTAGWVRPFSMLGSARKAAVEGLQTAASTPQPGLPLAPHDIRLEMLLSVKLMKATHCIERLQDCEKGFGSELNTLL